MSRAARSDLHDVEVTVHHETNSAWLVSTTGKRGDAVWMPKSVCEVERGPSTSTLTARARVLIDKGLV